MYYNLIKTIHWCKDRSKKKNDIEKYFFYADE